MTGFNNNQKRPKGIKLFKTLALVGFMIDIATFGAIFIVLGHDAGGPSECTTTNGLCPTPTHDGTQLGTWYNMPSTCPSQDACMIFNNQSLVQVLPFDGKLSAGTSVGTIAAYLSVGCITGSSSANDAYLQLQYALYSGQAAVSTGSSSNSTNWQNISRVYINTNGTYTPCVGTQIGTSSDLTGAVDTGASLNISSIGWVFRVVGFNGGGPGDNPRFSFITIPLENLLKRVATITVFTPLATGFQYAEEVNVPFTVSTAVSFQWIADNITSGGCGLGSSTTFHCWESGTGSCTFAALQGQCPTSGSNTVNFVTAFTSAVSVKVVGETKVNLANVEVPFGILPFFNSQSITV